MSNQARFDPVKELQNLSEQISKTVERGIRQVTSNNEQLQLDMYTADGHLYIRTQAIDGLVRDSIEIGLEDNLLSIAFHTEAEATPTFAQYHLQERRFGQVQRHIELPSAVHGEQASAKIEKGECRLLVVLPIDDSAHNTISMTPVE